MTTRPTLAFSQPDSATAVDHRSADNLALIADLVHMRTSSIGDAVRSMDGNEVRSVLEQVHSQVDTVVRLHRLRADASSDATIELGGYLKDISGAVVSALSIAGQVDLRVACDSPCPVPAQQASMIGLIVLELLTNAVKYAHPSGVPGKINVECRRPADGAVTVEVSDDGVGLPEGLDPVKDGRLGLRLARLLAAQLAARLSFDSTALGLSCVLHVPSGMST